MRKQYMLLLLALLCLFCLNGCNASVSEVGGADDSDVTVSTEKEPELDFGNLLEKYGYYAETFLPTGEKGRISVLMFAGAGEILEETDTYYVVKMSVYERLKVPADIQVGEKISLVINALTGEEQGFVCTGNEDGCPLFESQGNPNYYAYGEPDEEGKIPFYVDSEDAVCCYIGDYEVPVLKTAKDEILVAEEAKEVTPEILKQGYWTHIEFDENGYAVHLYFAGD